MAVTIGTTAVSRLTRFIFVDKDKSIDFIYATFDGLRALMVAGKGELGALVLICWVKDVLL